MAAWAKLSEWVAAAVDSGAGFALCLQNSLREMVGPSQPEQSAAFAMAVVALGAKMAKADGIVAGVEVEAFHRVFETTREQRHSVDRLFALAQEDVAGFEQYAERLRTLLHGDKTILTRVLELLFVIATADRALHPREDEFLSAVSERFGFQSSDYRNIRAKFIVDPTNPFQVLGLAPSVSNADITARYRELIRAGHPDRVTGDGGTADQIAIATRKMQAINEAYARLAKERGL